MAENMNPPPLTMDNDDENEDLFVSAIENNSCQTSVDTLKSCNNTLEDAISGSIEDEIDLGDYESDDPTSDKNKMNKSKDEEINYERDLLRSKDEKDDEENEKAKATIPVTASINAADYTSSKTTINRETNNEGDKVNNTDKFFQIKVGDPQKIGEGMGSFVCFKVTTKTNFPYWNEETTVSRRFSDFLGLRDKLAEKHIHAGHIVPPAPEKDAVGTAKVIMSKDETSTSSEFLERRAASLERFLNRISQHTILQNDSDFKEFLELQSELPRAKNTSALSGASVRRLFTRVGDTVSKMTFKMDETDPWFEEKQHQIENLDQQLRKVHASVDALIHHRKELTYTTGAFAKSAALLGNYEEHAALSCSLSSLSETEEKIEQLYNQQANNDFYHLSELLHDYIALIGVVKDIFHQRVKVYQTWQHAQQTLTKKREMKVKLELAGKSDRISSIVEEVIEWEAKTNRGQEEFERISKNIKQEVEKFELNRIKDFKTNIIKYMESFLNTQQQLIKYWEAFLPDAKAIS